MYNIRDSLQKSLSPLDKENYLNLSRWFDHLQQRPDINQERLCSTLQPFICTTGLREHIFKFWTKI